MRRFTWTLLALLPMSACNCTDPTLSSLPEPEAVLTFESQQTPPDDYLQLTFGNQLLETTTSKTFNVENRGNADLQVTGIAFVTDPTLCAVTSPAFSIQSPSPNSEGARTLTVGARPTEEDPILSEEVTVAFTPTDGSASCALIEVSTNDEEESGELRVLRVLLTGQGDAPQLCTSTPLIDFGELYVGETADDVVHLESCGTRPIQLTAMMANTEFPDPFTVEEPTFPVTLQPGETLDLPVHFTPLEIRSWTLAGGNAGALTFGSDTGLAYTISLEGTAVRRPSCSLDVVPVTMNFGTVAEGRDSTQSMVVRNIGDLDCQVDSVALRDAAGSFSLTFVDGTTFPATLAPTELFHVDVTFAPATAQGVENNFVDIVSDDPVDPAMEVPLEGTSIEPTPCFIEATPTGINFGNQATQSTTEVELLLTNVGTETCRVSDVSLQSGGADFDVVTGGFPLLGAIVNAGSSTTALVTFRPTSEGLKNGIVRATYSELGFGNPTQNLDIPVTGNGLDPALCVSPNHIDFGSVGIGANADEVATVSNCGAVDVEIRGIQLRAATHPDFVLPSLPSMPAALAPGDSFQLTVRAAPTNDGVTNAGAAMYGAVEVLSDDTNDPAIPVTLSANAPQCTTGLTCTPHTVDFGEIATDGEMIRAIACSNPGTTVVNISPSTVGAQFSVVHGPSSLAPGEVGVFTVRYGSPTEGHHEGELVTGANNCEGTPLNIDLVGDTTNVFLPPCPMPQAFNPEVVWHWEGGSTETGSKQVWTTPLMSRLEDTDGDGRVTRTDDPRVIFISFNHNDSPSLTDTDHINDPVPGVLRAVDGPTGAEVFTVSNPAYRMNSQVTPIVADIDADGMVEIVGQHWVLLEGVETIENGPKINGKFVRGNLIAFEHDGTFKWISEEWHRSEDEIEDTGGIAVADIDGDGFGELAVGDHVFDHNGNLLWAGGQGTGSTGHGPTSFFADMDGQPGLELVTGATVYNNDGSILWNRSDLLSFGLDNHAAAADLDNDGFNELVLRGGRIQVLDGATGTTIAGPFQPPTQMGMGAECDSNFGDPEDDDPCNIIPTNPAIVDVDGDGDLEIAVSSEGVILVYDHNLNEMWRSEIYDGTGASGPIGFDFEADGTTNVVYSDEGTVWVFAPNGTPIYDADRQSVTMMETASIGDVTLDGHANIAVGSNEPQFGTSDGLDLLTNTGISWAHARPMWNQHAYIESLIGEMGTLVFDPAAPGLTGFRTATPQCVP